MKKIIHIGIGKAASKELQRNIFPKISEFTGIPFYNALTLSQKLKLPRMGTNYLRKKSMDDKDVKIDLSDLKEFIISDETLYGYIFNNESQKIMAKKLFDLFGDVKIILFIRDPYEYLISEFRMNIRKLNYKNLKQFIGNYCYYYNYIEDDNYRIDLHKYYTRKNYLKTFSIKNISYILLVKYFKKYFKNITVIKLEDNNNIDELCNIFELNLDQKNQIIKIFKDTKKENISPNKLFFYFFLSLKKILSIFKIDLMKFDYQLKQIKLFKINKIYNKFFKMRLFYTSKFKIKVDHNELPNIMKKKYIIAKSIYKNTDYNLLKK